MTLALNISNSLGGEKSGSGYILKCPCHDDKNASLMISDVTDKNGNPDVSVSCFTGCDWKTIKDKFRDMGLLPEFKPEFQGAKQETVKRRFKKLPETPPPTNKKPKVKARTNFIWDMAKSSPDTVKKVFQHRAITIGHDSLAVRNGKYKDQNMLVFAMTKPGDDKVLAVQRMFYNSDTFKKSGKSKMFGTNPDNKDENFCHGRGVFFYRKKPVTDFIVGEGIETTLSAMQVMGMNGCACLSTAGVVNITLPDDIVNLYILVDSDQKFGGQKASIELAKKYKGKIKEIFLVSPCDSCFSDTPDKLDFNDLLMDDPTGQTVRGRFVGGIKNFNDFKWEPPANDKPDITDDDDYYTATTLKELHKLNETHAAVLMSGTFRVLKETYSATEKRHSVVFLTAGAFNDFYRVPKMLVKKDEGFKPISLGKLWLEWEGRRTYEDVVFDPADSITNNNYNLFKGLIPPVKGSWSKMKSHLQNVVCGGNVGYFEYLMAWLARSVQDTGGDRPGVSVVMKGRKGIGKSAWVDYFGKIFGESYFPIYDSNSFTGRFCMYQSKTLLLFLDEAVWGGDKKTIGKMNALITQEYNMFEPKGIDSISMRNYMNIIMAGNENWLVPATEDERRFFVLEVNDSHRKDLKYFDAFFHELKNGGPAAMLYDLLEYDYSGVNLRDAPLTEQLTEQIEYSLPVVLIFWKSVISRGFMLSDKMTGKPIETDLEDSGLGFWPGSVWKYELFREFQEWCNKKKERYLPVESKFWKETWKIWPGGTPKRMQKSVEYGQRLDIIVLPDLHDMRNSFTKATKVKFSESDEKPIINDSVSFNFGANVK